MNERVSIVCARFVKMPPLRALPLAILLATHHGVVMAELPVPSANFINVGEGIAVMQSNGINMIINQQTDRVIMNWGSFNVGNDNSVTFNQPGVGSVALNRIFQNDPSQILGAINANGQVYLYNQNGIIFGKGSRVNVASLVATSLNVDTNQFLQGALTNAIENGDAAFFDTSGNNTGIIDIRPGAEINANDPNGGRILIIAPEIINAGSLNSPDGQTILAASTDKVYLAVSDQDPSLRGLLVEVETGGSVTNLGSIIAERGNISLVGLAVNQLGRVRATTSIGKNGSIRLLARDNVILTDTSNVDATVAAAIGVSVKPTSDKVAVAQSSGRVILGSGSVTEVLLDNDTVTAVPDAQQQLQSSVEIVGKEIWLQKNSSIIAPSGNVKITATDEPASPMRDNVSNSSYVYMDEGSLIDVSGTTTTILAMERNSLEVEVRANELADSPLQRGGVLAGQKVYVDLSRGTDIIDYSGALANVKKTLTERMAAGGRVDIRSEGDVVQLDGSLMDISGGKVTFESGFIQESQLISDRRVYNLSDADKDRTYDAILGIETKTHERWGITETFDSFAGISSGRFVNGFVEGKAAGSISISASSTLLSSNGVRTETTIGPFQRESSKLPGGGELNIDLRSTIDRTQDVTFLAESMVDALTSDLANAPNLNDLQRTPITTDFILPDNYLERNKLSRLTISTNGAVIIDKAAVIKTMPGSSISLTGSDVTMDGSIISHAGDVSLEAAPVDTDTVANLSVGEDAVIDTSGFWVNESLVVGGPDSRTPLLIDGGNVMLKAEGDVKLSQGSLINASGGAWLNVDNKVTAGEGGDITLVANELGGSSVELGGSLQSYALFKGGELSIETASILISDAPPAAPLADQLVVNQQFFETGGFSGYTLTANAGNSVIDTVIKPIAKNLVFNTSNVNASNDTPRLNDNILLAPTGTLLQSITNITVLPEHLRQPVNFELNLDQTQTDQAYNLTVTEKAAIFAETGANVVLNSDTSIYMKGVIDAVGGNVSLNIKTPSQKTGFLANQAIWLAKGSRISARSGSILTPNEQSLRTGKVFDAGNVSLNADLGYVVIQDGALIDVSADNVVLDKLVAVEGQATEFQPVAVAPDAGTISLNAAEGIIIDGDLQANAASAVGARGGSLELGLSVGGRDIVPSDNNNFKEKFSFSSRNIVVTKNAANSLADNVLPGDAIDNSLNGIATLDIAKLEQGGFDSLSVKASDVAAENISNSSEIRFSSDVNLSLRNAISLNASTVNLDNHIANLQAAYINIGSNDQSGNSQTTASLVGSGDLLLNASLIDVVGNVDIAGVDALTMVAQEDVRFIGVPSAQVRDQLRGSLNTAADINITARQLYPVTNSSFEINLLNNPAGKISIGQIGRHAPVLSAGGSMTINAPIIEQGGVIKAPLGNIVLNATDDIRLLPKSVTSVSAEGSVIPYGVTTNAGTNWNYNIGGEIVSVELADKSVELIAPNIDMQPGSVVDLSGGGDLAAWEFVRGPGGSTDVLLADNSAGAFAILPDSDNQYAPYDSLLNDASLSPGDRVFFAGGNGIAEGFYTILPARYALLPGAKLVTPLKDINNIFPGKTITRADGVSVIAGKYGLANTDIIDSTWSAFVVENGSVARTRSEYIETFASDFFASTGRLPADAGSLVIDSVNSLSLAGTIKGDHVDGARGSRLDIVADNIEVVADAGIATNGFIQLVDDDLNNLGVNSMMLGGRRRIGDEVTAVAVRSNQVVIREDAQIEMPELLLVAKNGIETETGSSLNGTGASSNGITENLVLDNNASIVGVSVNPLVEMSRTGSSAGAAIILASGSSLSADKSIIIDSSSDVQLDAAINLTGGSLRLGANQINLGNVPAATSGLNLTATLLSNLNVDRLVMGSLNSVAIYDDVNLSFNDLELITPGINGISATGSNVILAANGSILLRQNGKVAQANGQGDGSFNISASEIIFSDDGQADADQNFVFDGFADATFTASQAVTGAGNGSGSFDFNAANVVVDTPLVNGEGGSRFAMRTTGTVDLRNTSTTVADASLVNALGGQLKIQARRINVDTQVVFPSGLIELSSTGLGNTDGVSLDSNAYLDVSGRTIRYVDGSLAGSSAGWVTLSSLNGSIDALSGSRINLSSSSVAGDAGYLELSASQGSATLNGVIETLSAQGFDGASLIVDVDNFTDTANFIQTIRSADFARSQSYRLRNGDFDVAALGIAELASGDANIKSSEIIIAADNGRVNISGKLDASGEKAGSVEIYASDDLNLIGADINASATSDEKGGSLVLGTVSGKITVDSATDINVAGANNAETGKVTLRAPRTDANSDIAINDFSASVTGAERINLEGVAVYNDSIIGNVQQTVYRNDAASWLSNTSGMAARLGLASDSRIHFLSGVEVFSNSNITVSDSIDFYQWQIDTADVIDQGAFTIRAANNLNINANISDAVVNQPIFGFGFVPAIVSGDSWNYRLVSGADISSANPMAYKSDSDAATGNLTLNSDVVIRTGNGDIDIASGGNLELTDQTSTIYTTGLPNGTGQFDAILLEFTVIPDGPEFPDSGGDISIRVARDINAAVSNQFFTDWLQRAGGDTPLFSDKTTPGFWGVVLNDFEQGVATLGGDIDVYAGGDINNLSISTPRTGQLDSNDEVVIRGGGNINVFAGNNYRSARILADGGVASIRVRGDIASGVGLETLLAIGDARVEIEAGGDIGIDGIGNMTMLPMSTLQSGKFADVLANRNYFFTYTDRSSVDLLSHYGDINFNNDTIAISNAPNNLVGGATEFSMWSIYPGDLRAASLTGDINLNHSFTMFPDADGNLALLAAGDITSRNTGDTTQINVLMSDVSISELPSIAAPDNRLVATGLRLIGAPTDQSSRHDINAPVHQSDPNPVLFVANGDITINDPLKLLLPKKAHIYAGSDITNLAVDIQNINLTDISLFIAGGDISYPIPESGSSFISGGIKVTGPGSINVLAGGNIDLGISKGIRSLGNIDNFVLPEQGADISVFAGLDRQLESSSFIATYFEGDTSGDAALINIDVKSYQQQLIDFVLSEQYSGDIVTAVSAATSELFSKREEAIVAFRQLSEQQQLDIALASFKSDSFQEQNNLLLNVLFSEINLAANEQATSGDNEAYARGFLAINRLFNTGSVQSASAANKGDINLPFSRILSTSGGDINLLMPNGELTVGFTAEVKNSSPSAGALGVIVSGKGNLSALTESNINVNLARMLTLDGGDISLWSSSGDIDAGRGAKSELTIPPPLTIVDKQTGQIKVIFPPAISGSGIGAASFSTGQSPGQVTLAAPGGVINASDAGIRSDGDIVLAATKVLGGDNISAGGAAVGVPVVTNVTAGLSGLSGAADNAIKGASDSISRAVAGSSDNEGVALVTIELLTTDDELNR